MIHTGNSDNIIGLCINITSTISFSAKFQMNRNYRGFSINEPNGLAVEQTNHLMQFKLMQPKMNLILKE